MKAAALLTPSIFSHKPNKSHLQFLGILRNFQSFAVSCRHQPQASFLPTFSWRTNQQQTKKPTLGQGLWLLMILCPSILSNYCSLLVVGGRFPNLGMSQFGLLFIIIFLQWFFFFFLLCILCVWWFAYMGLSLTPFYLIFSFSSACCLIRLMCRFYVLIGWKFDFVDEKIEAFPLFLQN